MLPTTANFVSSAEAAEKSTGSTVYATRDPELAEREQAVHEAATEEAATFEAAELGRETRISVGVPTPTADPQPGRRRARGRRRGCRGPRGPRAGEKRSRDAVIRLRGPTWAASKGL